MSISEVAATQQSPAVADAATPQKSLNANAKAFQPKLDGPTLQDATTQQASQNQALGRHNHPTPSRVAAPQTRPIQPPTPFAPLPLAFPSVLPLAGSLLMPGVPPPPTGPSRIPPVPPFNPVVFGVPPPTSVPSPVFMAPPPSPSVNVGNAALVALRSKEPPKFSCILLVGLPSSGKTTIGRELVNGLNADSLGWSFFSGSDHLKEGDRRPFWENTKEVFDALSARLDQLMVKQQNPETRIKGLVIDKNCRGVEDFLYLVSLLKAKGLPLVGVIGLEVKEDDVLIQRMGGGEELHEKLKFHRVMQARVIETARGAGLYRSVDATKPREAATLAVRTWVLGFSAQPLRTIKPLTWSSYSDSTCPVVESYDEYCSVMTTLFSLLRPSTGAGQWWDHKFPGFTDYTPLSVRELEDPSKMTNLRNNYSLRRKSDGAKHVLVYDGNGLYLVPRHMRAVLKMPSEAWLGMPIANMGRLIFDGDLVRLTKDRTKEKFLVYDTLYWSDAPSPNSNLVRLASWKERQERLSSSICHEASAFFQKSSNVVIVHQRAEPWDRALDLLEPLDYPLDGLIIQPRQAGQHPTFVWRPPQAITCDLRLGALLGAVPVEPATPQTPEKLARQGSSNFEAAAQPQKKTYALEVYDRELKRYVRLRDEEVEVRRNDVVEGCLCVCGLSFDASGDHHWTFHRARYDVSRAAYKSAVDDLVENCLIARARLVSWLIAEKFVAVQRDAVPEATSTPAAVAAAPSAQAAAAILPQPQAAAAAAPPVAPRGVVSRGAFGSALETPSAATPPAKTQVSYSAAVTAPLTAPQPPAAAAPTSNLEMLQRMVPATKVQSKVSAARTPSLQMLESVVGNVNVVRSGEDPADGVEKAAKQLNEASSSAAAAAQQTTAKSSATRCAECKKAKRSEDLRKDKRDDKLYCYACWAKAGTEFCTECREFRAGHRQTSDDGHVGAFYCEPCWDEYQHAQELKQSAAKKGPKAATGDKQKKPKKDAAKAVEPSTEEGTVVEAAATLVETTENPTVDAEGDAATAEKPNGEKKRRRRGGRGKRKKGASADGNNDDGSGSESEEKEKSNEQPAEAPADDLKSEAAPSEPPKPAAQQSATADPVASS